MSQARMSALVVDDDPVSRQIALRTLAKAGFHCDTAIDGSEARQFLAASRYDLVVTDLQMPNGNGHALCVALLAQSPRPAIIVLTGVTDSRLAKDLLGRGVDEVFFKPIDCQSLAAKAESLCAAVQPSG
ncbi:MAG TPA: response regulator [Pirellulales bacterium]|nr:response regulator [Pirellulales bacterium]